MTTYATVAELKARADASSGTTYSEAENATFLACLDSASRAIDGYCRRQFGQSSSGTARYYTPTDGMRLRVHDLVSVSALATDDDGDLTYEQSWAATDYLLMPTDAASAANEIARPYTEIVVSLATGSNKYTFPVGYQRSVKVTGVWGWPAVPSVVRDVCILEALRAFNQFQAPTGVIQNPAGGNTLVPSLHPDSRLRLGPYIRIGRTL